MKISNFTSSKMTRHNTAIKTSEATLMTPYHANGWDEEVALIIPHDHLI
jgi:hypothetical protein